jgi:hypothetical protein
MAGYNWRRPFCHAWGKSRGRPCQRKVGYRRDGSLHVVCPSHGSKTPPYAERPISVAGKQRIAEAQRRRWARFRADRAAGISYKGKPLGRPPKPRTKAMTTAEWYAAKGQRVRDFLDPERWGK